MVAEGVKSVPEMSRHLSCFLKSEMFRERDIPEKSNRRFHPTKRAIRAHMYTATVKQQLSFIDQENAASLVEKWAVENPNDHYFFRPHSSSDKHNAVPVPTDDFMEEKNDNDDTTSVTYRSSNTTTLLFCPSDKGTATIN